MISRNGRSSKQKWLSSACSVTPVWRSGVETTKTTWLTAGSHFTQNLIRRRSYQPRNSAISAETPRPASVLLAKLALCESKRLRTRKENIGNTRRSPLGTKRRFQGSFLHKYSSPSCQRNWIPRCPFLESLKKMIELEHLWPFENDGEIDPQWRAKAVASFPDESLHDGRIRLMANQISILFNVTPGQLESFIQASQICQSEAMKFFIERFRMGNWRRTGILWWNIRDGLPLISDAIVDYYNRPKLAYSYIK